MDSTGMVPRHWQPEHGAFTLFERRVDGQNEKTYWIKFAGSDVYLPDPDGPSRGACSKVLKPRKMLSTDVIDPILRAQREAYPAVFAPTELVHVPAAGIPPLASDDRLAAKRGFRPDSHQVIVRMVHFEEPKHWTLLMHFIPIETVLVWDAVGGDEDKGDAEDAEKEDEAAEELQGLSRADCYTLYRHARWTQGTVAEAKHQGGTRWRKQLALGHGTQKDDWSCGLWCLARIEDLYRTLNERIAVDTTQIDYEKVVDTLVLCYSQAPAKRTDLKRANSRPQLAHSLGYEVKG